MTPESGNSVRFATILFATDLSEVSAKALLYAASFAQRWDAELLVVHVTEAETYEHETETGTADAATNFRREAETRINRLLEARHLRAIRLRFIWVEGEILPALAALVEQKKVDLLVFGMHGKHGLTKMLQGSLAEELLRLAEIPMLVVGPEISLPPQEEIAIHRVLYAADFSPQSGRALQFAGALASVEHARLLVLHVVEDAWKEPASTRLQAEDYLRARLLEEGWMDSIDSVAPELLVDFGPAEDRILQAAGQHRVDLIVLDVPSSKHPVLSAHMPGPLAYNVASHAHCPVLAVSA